MAPASRFGGLSSPALVGAEGGGAPCPPPGDVALRVVGPEALARQPGFMAYFVGFSPADCAARGLPPGSTPAQRAQAYLADVLPSPATGGVEPGPGLARLRGDVADAEAAITARGLCRWLSQAELGPWCIALMRGHAEAGYPHTHGGVICLPLRWLAAEDAAARVRLLVHERVHVFQRARPQQVRGMLAATWGVRPAGPAARLLPAHLARRLRANPDLDGMLYLDPQRLEGGAAAQLFRDDAPRSLADSEVVRVRPPRPGEASWQLADGLTPEYEHPYEEMAYAVAAAVVPP